MTDTYTQEQAVATALYAIAASLDRMADAVNANTAALQVMRTSPGAVGGTAAAPGGLPPAPRGAPGPVTQKTPQQKMSGKVFAICKAQGWDIADIGTRVMQRPMMADSRNWTVEELGAVLDAMKEWGFN